MTPTEFRQWRLRMGKLTIQGTADILGCSYGSAKGFGDGLRVVPFYIQKLTETLEREKIRQEIEMEKNRNNRQPMSQAPDNAQIPAEGLNIAAILATAYRQVAARSSPIRAMTMSIELLEQEFKDALETLSQNGVEIHATDKAENNKTAS